MPCMMKLGTLALLFIHKIYYLFNVPFDSTVKWAGKNWNEYDVESFFRLPVMTLGILENESKKL